LAEINAREIGLAAVELGAGRARKDDLIDHAVGLVVHHKVGDRVRRGEPLLTIHANAAEKLEPAKTRALAAHKFSAKKVKPLPLFYKILNG
jgi:pyrimidine-nucleoside phosphorylase